jgi:hypothetical protein
MFALGNTLTYHLYRADCDMRKSFDGLCGVVRTELGRQPASGEVFVFVNRRRTLIKLFELATRRICAVLQTPGVGHLSDASAGREYDAYSVDGSGADDRGNPGGKSPHVSAVRRRKKQHK